jgi:hypothetical protein
MIYLLMATVWVATPHEEVGNPERAERKKLEAAGNARTLKKSH